MKENQFFRQGLRGFFISLVCILLALWAVSISAKYLYPENPYCGDMVGAGFPVPIPPNAASRANTGAARSPAKLHGPHLHCSTPCWLAVAVA